MTRVAIPFPKQIVVKPVKRKKTHTMRHVTPRRFLALVKRMVRVEAANRKLRKRLQKAGL
jgi:hypothetical protein